MEVIWKETKTGVEACGLGLLIRILPGS